MHSSGILISFIVFSSVFGYHGCKCPHHAKYRTFDGSCNNLNHPNWGKSDTLQRRFTDWRGKPMVDFADGKGLPRGYPDKLPDPRRVSNVLSKTTGHNKEDVYRTGQHMAFGQLLTHDILQTVLHSADCCQYPNFDNQDVCYPFNIPKHDDVFQAGCKSFARARRATKGKLPDYRENVNRLSSFIDATFLYGDDLETANYLRVPNSYLMKTDHYDLLPTIDGGSCFKKAKTDRCPYAGDQRVTEAPNLGLNHLLFVREHNRLANLLKELNPYWNNEKVYQETRRIIIAQVQHITYNHFLPSVVLPHTMLAYHLYSLSTGYSNVYDDKIDMSIRNGFGTAPLRYGHSQVMATISELKRDFQTLTEHKMEDNLMSPHLYQRNHGMGVVEDMARWLVTKPALKIDHEFVDSIRDKLFYLSQPPGNDLVSLNIQRGRDQGTPSYNKWREFCGLRNYTTFSEFGYLGYKLARLYNTVDDIDFYVGGLLEKGEKGSVGPTFSCVIGLQFYLLKIGDRFWYESGDKDFAFSLDQLNSIKGYTTLAKMFCINFGLKKIQKDVFTIPSEDNPLVDCDDIPDIDLRLWKDA